MTLVAQPRNARSAGRLARMLPSEPLVVAVQREVERGTRPLEQVMQDCHVSSKRYRDWRRHGTPVEVETADKMLVGLGLLWFDCFDEDRWPEAYAQAERAFG